MPGTGAQGGDRPPANPAAGPPPQRHPDDGDGWAQCGCGQRHWGRYGAAGLLLADGAGQVVLQHRAPWSHHGDTWGIPGGARNREETAVQAAVREAGEEAGVSGPVHPHASHLLDHPDWSYTTVLAHVPPGMPVHASDAESVHVRWHPAAQVTDLPLLNAFARAWPLLQQMLATRAVLVVDAANVVGARPDGWWKDRAAATTRLAHRLAVLVRHGMPAADLELPGHTWWPAVVLVTEGQARQAAGVEGVQVVRAEGEGDEAIVQSVEQARSGAFSSGARTADGEVNPQVSVVTADRGLRHRVQAAGAQVLGPGRLWRLLDSLPT